MNYISRWIVAGVLILFTFLFFNKGLDLWSLGANVDGDGIGVNFLGFEVNDRVSEESISSYAIGFFISSFITFIIAIALLVKSIKSKRKRLRYKLN